MRSKYFGKSTIIGITTLIITVLMLLMVPIIVAQNPEEQTYVGIQGENDTYCHLIDGNGIEVKVPLEEEEVKINVSYNPRENILLQCDFIVDPSEEGGAELWDNVNTGFDCFVYQDGEPEPISNSTQTKWNIVVSASGNARLTCHFETDIG